MWGVACFGASDTRRRKGTGPQLPSNFRNLLHVRTQYEKQQPNVVVLCSRCAENIFFSVSLSLLLLCPVLSVLSFIASCVIVFLV